jgi:hypothetical protein
VHSYDFWWHLATGKYIVENGSLPESDPFSYTASDIEIERKPVILKGYWLSQIIFYAIYSVWSLKGIIIFRSLFMIITLFFIFMTIRKQNASLPLALIMTMGFYLIQNSYSGERPVLFTYLVFSISYYLLEDFRINRSRSVFLIPPLVMLLSNLHLGYVVCIMLVTLYLAGEGLERLFRKDYDNAVLKGLVLVWILTIIASIANPNGAIMLKRIFYVHSSTHIQGIAEFTPTFTLYKYKVSEFNYLIAAFFLCSLLALRYFKKTGFTHILLLAVFTVMSLSALRYNIFYAAVAAPILARVIIFTKNEKIMNRLINSIKIGKGVTHIVFFMCGLFLVFYILPSFARDDFRARTDYMVPERAADFLARVKIDGNMFNEFGFGGYLIWRLYPDKKVFIDGRALEPDIYTEYQNVVHLSSENWDDILEKHDISHVVIPSIFYHGNIMYFTEELFDNDDWVLLYADHLSLVFLRNEPEHSSLIKEYSIDKNIGMNTIIIQATIRAMRNPSNPYFLITLGKAFFRMGRIDDAEKAFTMAASRDPGNKEITFWLQKLKETKQ